MILDKTAIDAALGDLKVAEIEAVEGGGKVGIRMWMSDEAEPILDQLAEYTKEKKDRKGGADELESEDTFKRRVLAVSLCTADGSHMYSCGDDLREMNWKAINRLFEAVLDLNGLGEDAVEDAAKNSQTTPD